MKTVPARFSATIDLPPQSHSVPAARRVVVELLDSWAVGHLRERAALLVSELVTNVVRHVAGQSKMVLQVNLTEPALRVSVTDVSLDGPRLREPMAEEPGGHGLRLLAAVADRWGTEQRPGGKQVWFELVSTAG